MTMRNRRTRFLVAGLIAVFTLASLAAWWTAPTRRSVRNLTLMINAGNRGDLDEARTYCSARFLKNEGLSLAPEGGLEGLPRGIHKNFQTWQFPEKVWICATNRIGPVYQFVPNAGNWLYDGLVAMRDADGTFQLKTDTVIIRVPGPPTNSSSSPVAP